jgi:hypothetical protein
VSLNEHGFDMHPRVRHVQSLDRGIADELLIRHAEKLKNRAWAEMRAVRWLLVGG